MAESTGDNKSIPSPRYVVVNESCDRGERIVRHPILIKISTHKLEQTLILDSFMPLVVLSTPIRIVWLKRFGFIITHFHNTVNNNFNSYLRVICELIYELVKDSSTLLILPIIIRFRYGFQVQGWAEVVLVSISKMQRCKVKKNSEI